MPAIFERKIITREALAARRPALAGPVSSIFSIAVT
jgi:hypothetical protein